MKDSAGQKTTLRFLIIGVILVALYFVFLGNRGERVGLKNIETGDAEIGVESSERRAGEEGVVIAGGKYQDFSEAAFAAAAGKRRVYFFSATWCSTCKVAHQDFLKRADLLPDDVAVFKIDYDSNRVLRKKFAIPYQHTFVEVDENGEKLQAWSGGAVDEMLQFMK